MVDEEKEAKRARHNKHEKIRKDKIKENIMKLRGYVPENYNEPHLVSVDYHRTAQNFNLYPVRTPSQFNEARSLK